MRTNTEFGSLLQTTGSFDLKVYQKRPKLMIRRGIVFQQGNTTSVVSRQKFRKLGREILKNPPYSANLTLNNYHAFLALQIFINNKKLTSRKYCENGILKFFVRSKISLTEAS